MARIHRDVIEAHNDGLLRHVRDDYDHLGERLARRHVDIEAVRAKVAAFGMTRRKNCDPATDICLKALVDAQAAVITIVGKTWDMHVTEVLGTTPVTAGATGE